MVSTAERLVKTTRAMLERKGLDDITGEPGYASGEPWGDASEATDLADIFELSFGSECPPSFRSALLLPDRVALRWTDGEVAGEYDIANPLMALERKLDPSLASESIEGLHLADFRIIDQVVAQAGPLFVGFEIGTNGRLHLYDTREMRALDIDLHAYFGWAADLRGLVFWQFLFAKGRLTPDKAAALTTGLEWLERNEANDSVVAASKRLAERK
jgi:hypothetical protein